MGNARSKNALIGNIDFTPQELVFQNHLLLGCIVSNLSFHDLLKMREVCHLWKRVVFPHVMENPRMVNFDWLGKHFCTKYIHPKERRIHLEQFVKNILKSDEPLPLTKFEIDLKPLEEFCEDKKVKRLIFHKLFPVLASQATEFELHYTDPKPMTWAAVEYPDLQSLTITCRKLKSLYGNVTHNKDIFAHIVEKSPALKIVNFDEYPWRCGCENLFIPALRKLNGRPVEEFYFRGYVGNAWLQALLNIKPNSMLEFKLLVESESKFEPERLSYVFLNQNNSLHSLFLSINQTVNMSLRFPIMKTLKKLEIAGCRNITFPELCFAKSFPALKSLELCFYESEDLQNLLTFPQNKCLTIKWLELPSGLVDPSALVKAAQVFPNAKTLKMDGYVLCENNSALEWKHVTRLSVLEDFTEDALLKMATGVNVEFLEKLKYLNLRHCHITPQFYSEVVPALRSLECLDFRGTNGRNIQMEDWMFSDMCQRFSVLEGYPYWNTEHE